MLLGNVLADLPDGELLFFAPELILLRWLSDHSTLKIVTTDYNSADVDYSGEDIQQLSFPSESFAAILCNHVLEHVPDDRQALMETARVLKPGGVAVFTIPGDYDKQTTRHFDTPDGNGHFRHYGLEVVDLMRSAFPKVETIDMGAQCDPKFGVRRGDMAFVCRK